MTPPAPHESSSGDATGRGAGPRSRRPLIVRLRNWVGDVILGVPALERLAGAGYDLTLIGKGWARELLAGHGWPVHVLAKTWRERVAQLRGLRAEALRADPGFGSRINAVCFPYSFSSALEFRLAGLRAIGHAYEGRSPLLARAVPRPTGAHELAVYWQLAGALLGGAAAEAPLPSRIGLRIADRHRAEARALLARHGVGAGPIVICPFVGGTWSGEDKSWPEFDVFAAHDLPALGRPVVICPGPGEEALARERYGHAHGLEGVSLGAYAALLDEAALMISNDTGPGHLAAAVGAPLVSVLGPSDPAQWGAWGPTVRIAKGDPKWPTRAAVLAAAREMLREPGAAGPPLAPN